MAAAATGRAGEPRIRVGATPVRGTAGGDNPGLRCNLSNAAATGTGRRRGLDVAVRRRGACTKSLYHHGGWRIASQRMAQYGSRTHSSPYALPGTSRELHRPGRLDPCTLTRRGYTCCGIDADPAMIARARTGRPGRYELRRMQEIAGLAAELRGASVRVTEVAGGFDHSVYDPQDSFIAVVSAVAE